jgi:hypothetical protein
LWISNVPLAANITTSRVPEGNQAMSSMTLIMHQGTQWVCETSHKEEPALPAGIAIVTATAMVLSLQPHQVN